MIVAIVRRIPTSSKIIVHCGRLKFPLLWNASSEAVFEAVTEFNKLCFARDNGAAIDSVFITVGEAYENFCTIADQYSSSIPPTQAGERDRFVTTVQDAHLQWEQMQNKLGVKATNPFFFN